ncbi:unnamed protein product [Discula destructiva]
MSEAPKLRMLELSLCREYHSSRDPSVINDDGSVPEDLCKLPEIHSSLAKQLGLLAMLGGLPGLVLAVPYGMLADHRSRKLVAGLCVAGFILRDLCYYFVLYFYNTFPQRAVYAAPLFTIIGGGTTVINPMIMAIIAASVSDASRIQAFFLIHVTTLVTELISPPLGSLLMDTLGPHFAFLAGVPFEIAAFSALGLVEEPRSKRCQEVESNDDEHENFHNNLASETKPNFRKPLMKVVHYFRQDIGGLLSQKSLLLGLLAVVGCRLGRPMLVLTLQYMSVRFGWHFSKTGYLLSIQAATQIFIFLVVLPAVSAWLLRRKGDAPAADLALARGSVMVLSLSTLAMGLAPLAPVFITFMVTYNFGNGFASAMRAFLTSLVPEDRIATLFTTIALFEGLSGFIVPPLLGYAFSIGLGLGGLAMSIPFFIVASIYGLGFLLVWSIKH